MRYAQRCHGDSLPVEHGRRFYFRNINNADIETNASTRAAQRATEHLKGAIFLIEEATEERRKAWRHVVAGRPGNGNGSLRA